jgi:SAM-dependent methyltransferase
MTVSPKLQECVDLDVSESLVFRASELKQELHYDAISADYEVHYSDEWSRDYRWRFIYEPMFAGLDLSNMTVLDAMCGSGQTTEYLLSKHADVTGLDISNEAIESFANRWSRSKALRRSLFNSGLEADSFDCVAIVGGLHHIHPHVNEGLAEIHRVLKPGGYFCFMEPHAGSLPDMVRKIWYKYDRLFADNEAAIDLNALETEFADRFAFQRVKYQGNIAFLLVLNSLVFRIPSAWKPFYSKPLMTMESVINFFQGRLSSCFVVAQWQKI